MCALRTSQILMNNTEARDLHVLFRDGHLLAVNKPPGIAVQKDRSGDRCLQDLVQVLCPGVTVGFPHRLDRPVGGVTVFTLDTATLRGMDALFREKKVAKTYLAIVEGLAPENGMLMHRLKHAAGSRKSIAVQAEGEGEGTSVLKFARRSAGDRYSLLEVAPMGGAFHQIRAQLAAAGFPIKGDVKYGARRGERDRSIALHAWRMSFTHPITGAGMTLEAPPPTTSIWPAMRSLWVP